MEPESQPTCYSTFNLELKRYYGWIFPYGKYFDWLNYEHEGFNKTGIAGQLPYREFSFTLDGDVYIRHCTFDTKEKLRAEIKKLNPIKIDIGAEYSDRPDKLRSRILVPERRELVFDIDMTDYDDVRKCCQKENICDKCWKFMKIAVKIIETVLVEDFGYHHSLWVFSGRRGVHCWVCDKAARGMPTEARTAIADYLSLAITKYNSKKLYLFQRTNLHPCITRACKIIDQYFVELCVVDQDILGTQTDMDKFIEYIPDKKFGQQLALDFNSCTTSLERWNAFLALYDNYQQKGMLKYNMVNVRELMKVIYAYPRLDVNVTKGFKHLLKSPFCIHPKTGKVCVPFSARAVDKFDPFKVPQVGQILDELEIFDCKRIMRDQIKYLDKFPTEKFSEMARKTSLIKAINIFDQFLSKLKKYNGGPPPESLDL